MSPTPEPSLRRYTRERGPQDAALRSAQHSSVGGEERYPGPDQGARLQRRRDPDRGRRSPGPTERSARGRTIGRAAKGRQRRRTPCLHRGVGCPRRGRVVEPLVTALKDPDPDVRAAAAKAVYRRLMTDPDQDTRRATASALGPV